jgi:hypothetical protein
MFFNTNQHRKRALSSLFEAVSYCMLVRWLSVRSWWLNVKADHQVGERHLAPCTLHLGKAAGKNDRSRAVRGSLEKERL